MRIAENCAIRQILDLHSRLHAACHRVSGGQARRRSIRGRPLPALLPGRSGLSRGKADSGKVLRRRAAGGGGQILVIAVLMKGILGRAFNVFQWEALLLLVAGITVNQLNYCGRAAGGSPPPHPLLCSAAARCKPS